MTAKRWRMRKILIIHVIGLIRMELKKGKEKAQLKLRF